MATTRRRWLEEGLAVLAEAGASALTIEALTSRLGVTKGSFYHHFHNFQDYKEQLLTFFEQEGTLRIIEHTQQLQTSPLDRLHQILQGSLRHPSQLEVAVRAWAYQDSLVHAYQQRIDQRRLAYLAELIFLLCHDHGQARRTAQVLYSIFVGSQHFLPPVQGDELEALYREVARISDFLLLPAGRKTDRKESEDAKE
ncbi:TetR/AcrR family transcriptional regulator [Ktedonosporobacter rubrisoli]|uniref:TetR/AcrR family transcriptional regulator n=1 Tax=Ktedonosporobacter rubrisoli TaxID=2509675 RepID=A0A4P6JVX4_KTERU|nr:TetR/AcrR family transcriptional regulator [Ktedonosporobacter rubrisoli]QBD79694.1 TetR/AcrR family transcriptional regulator [Ktedonosporobacter rubrisoli]